MLHTGQLARTTAIEREIKRENGRVRARPSIDSLRHHRPEAGAEADRPQSFGHSGYSSTSCGCGSERIGQGIHWLDLAQLHVMSVANAAICGHSAQRRTIGPSGPMSSAQFAACRSLLRLPWATIVMMRLMYSFSRGQPRRQCRRHHYRHLKC